MITSARMAAVDENAASLGVPRRQLMESSGNAIARLVREQTESGDRVVFVCGRGNNGGDGFVAARFLQDRHVNVYLLGRPDALTTEIARANWNALQKAEYACEYVRDSRDLDIADAAVVVDAIVGTGVRGELREPAATAVEQINEHPGEVIAVDVPSGVDPNSGETNGPAVDADRVVTFHDSKPGLADLDIPITVANIGIPAAAERFVGPGDVGSFSRDPDSHKGDAGRILVIGGGPYTGAPALTATAAMRTGADLGIIACPDAVETAIQSFAPDLIVRGFDGERLTPDVVPWLLDEGDAADVVVIGPGLGDADETQTAVSEFLTAFEGRAIVDADALRTVPAVETDATLICTPHQGELVTMGGTRHDDWEERAEVVESFATELGHTLVVKGRYDIISDGTDTRVNRTGNPGMTAGGTGDVLAGVIASLFAHASRDGLAAGAVGAYLTGEAGDAALEHSGYGLLASDVIAELPGVIWGETHGR